VENRKQQVQFKHLFISHSTKDREIAEKVVEHLENNGVNCWIAPRDISFGIQWAEGIMDGIENASGMMLLFSIHSNKSQMVQREIERAINKGIPVYPLRIEDVELSKAMEFYISLHQWKDAFDGSIEDSISKLIPDIKLKLGIEVLEEQTNTSSSVEGNVTQVKSEYAEGDKIGSYLLGKKLGCGVFGNLFLGTHIYLNTKVAIKILDENYGSDSLIKSRMLLEAKTLQKLQHINIVELKDFFEVNGRFVLVTDYIKDVIPITGNNIGPIPYKKALSFFNQILNAVSYIHSKGIVHRDLKPTNVLVDKSNNVKITDFSVAYSHGCEDWDSRAVGTFFYMSPENASGSGVDHRSDIYSLGIILYEMLTGVNPLSKYHFDNQKTIIEHIVSIEFPDPREYFPNIPNWLVDIIKKSIAKRPDNRYQSCDDFLEALNTASIIKPEKNLGQADLNEVVTAQLEIETVTPSKVITSKQNASTDTSSEKTQQSSSSTSSNIWIPRNIILFIVAIAIILVTFLFKVFDFDSPEVDLAGIELSIVNTDIHHEPDVFTIKFPTSEIISFKDITLTNDGGFLVSFVDTIGNGVMKLDSRGNEQWRYQDSGMGTFSSSSLGSSFYTAVYPGSDSLGVFIRYVILDENGSEIEKTDIMRSDSINYHSVSRLTCSSDSVITVIIGSHTTSQISSSARFIQYSLNGIVANHPTEMYTTNFPKISITHAADGGFLTAASDYRTVPHSIIIQKLSADGELEWSESFQSGSSDIIYAPILPLPNDEYLLCATWDQAGLSNGETIVIRIDGSGNEISRSIFHGCGNGLTLCDDGYMIAAYNLSQENRNLDILVIRADMNGNILWEKELDSGYDDYPVMASGTSDQAMIFPCDNYFGESSSFIVKIDSDGFYDSLSFTNNFFLTETWSEGVNGNIWEEISVATRFYETEAGLHDFGREDSSSLDLNGSRLILKEEFRLQESLSITAWIFIQKPALRCGFQEYSGYDDNITFGLEVQSLGDSVDTVLSLETIELTWDYSEWQDSLDIGQQVMLNRLTENSNELLRIESDSLWLEYNHWNNFVMLIDSTNNISLILNDSLFFQKSLGTIEGSAQFYLDGWSDTEAHFVDDITVEFEY